MTLLEGVIFGLIAMSAWGISDFYLKRVTDKLGSLRTLFWIGLVQVIPLSFYFLINSVNFSLIQNYIGLLMLSAGLDFLGYIFFLRGVKKGLISIIGPISSAWVVPAVILSVIFLGETLSPPQVSVISLIIAGIFIMSFKYTDIKSMRMSKLLPGVPEGLISVIFFGMNLPLLGFLISKIDWFLPVFFVRAGNLVLALFYTKFKKVDLRLKENIKIPLVLAGFTSAAGFLAWSIGVHLLSVSIVTPLAASFPFITVILARIFYKEKIELIQKVGVIGTVLGIILLSII